MKRIAIFYTMAVTLFVSPVLAQDVETFDAYGTDLEMTAKWTGPAGFPVLALGLGGGADSTANFLNLQDNGFSMTAKGTDLMSPAAGNFTLEFWYQNGIGGEAMSALVVDIVQDATTKLTVNLGNDAKLEWTKVVSNAVMLSGSPVTIQIRAANGAEASHRAYFDQFVLVPLVSVPLDLTVYPDDRIYMSNNAKIRATPTFGSETYTKVDFDVNNDGSIEFTDNAAPFEFDWDTLDHVIAGTSRTLSSVPANTPIPVKITVTDSNNNTKSIIEDYTVDNEFGGRESLVINGDFSQWQGAGFGANLPVGWVENYTTPTSAQYGIGLGRNVAAGDALQITMPTAPAELDPFNDRYALRTVGKMGNYRDLQTTFWGKGTYARLYYMTSTDGFTFSTSLQSAGIADGANWNFAVQTPVQNGLGLTDSSHVALGTHQLGTTDHFWDDVVSEGNLITITSDVDEWKFY